LVVLAAGLVLSGADLAAAQSKRKSTRRPASTTTAPAGEVRVVSTADEDQDSGSTSRTTTRPRSGGTDVPPAATSMSGLAQQVKTLNQRIAQMEASQKALVDLERLNRAEQRAEVLRSQLLAAQDREGVLQARLQELEFELRPEVIENGSAVNGSTRPELVREQRRKYLEVERVKLTAQLSQLTSSRARLETAVANADALVDRLRRTVDTESIDSESESIGAGSTNAAPETQAPVVLPDYGTRPENAEPESVPADPELVQIIKNNLAEAGITTVQVEAANGAVILTGEILSAQVPAALRAASDAKPRRIYNQMTVK
jgi:hypothetical protein